MIHTILFDVYIAVGVVFLFGAAIFVHEFGHFWMARKRGLKIEGFAIGFGPKMFSWVRNGIEYSVRWIPAGGFVKLPQMVTSAALEGDKKEGSIPPAPPLSKILVAVAGPAMNVVFAFFIATIIYFVGLPVPVNPSVIGYVDPSSAEGKLGIKKGDRIVAVNGKPVESWEEVIYSSVLALTNSLPVSIRHETVNGTQGATETYVLQTDTNNLLGFKTFNLDPLNYLVVKEVLPGRPADKAKVLPDDELVDFAGVPITSQQQFINLIQKRQGQSTPLIVVRNHQRVTLQVEPALDATAKRVQVGIAFMPAKDIYVVEHPSPWAQVKDVLDQIYRTVTALVHSRESGVKARDLSGPVGIIGVLAVQFNTDYRLALHFLVLLNINLAILNLMPIPVLDGGHIIMALLERIRRRALGVRFVEYVTTVFASLLILFMIYVTWFDIKRIPFFHMVFNRETQIEQPAQPPAANPASPSAP